MFLKISTAVVSGITIAIALTQLILHPDQRLISVVLILISISQIIFVFFQRNERLIKLTGINTLIVAILLAYIVISKILT